jgi:flagellar biosynthesis component FlhA
MAFGLAQVLYIIATILLVLSVLPPVPDPWHLRTMGVGLAFLAAGHAVGG